MVSGNAQSLSGLVRFAEVRFTPPRNNLAMSIKSHGLSCMVITGALLNAYATFQFAGFTWWPIALGGLFGAVPLLALFSWHDRNLESRWLRRAWNPLVVILGGAGLGDLFLNALNAQETQGGEQMSVFMLPMLLLAIFIAVIVLAELLSGVIYVVQKVRRKHAQ